MSTPPPPAPPPPPPPAPHSPLTCKQLFDFLADYVDGDLPAPQREAFDKHMHACPSCVAYVDGYRRTIALGKASCCGDQPEGPAKAPEALLDAVRAAIRANRPQAPKP